MTPLPPPEEFEPKPSLHDHSITRWHGKEPEPLVMTVDEMVPEGMLTLLVSPGGAGKTLLAQMMLMSVAQGSYFLGRQTTAGPAVGLFAEDPDNLLHLRQERINDHFGVDIADLQNDVFVRSLFGQDAALWHDGPTDLFLGLRQDILDIRPKLVTIDNAALVYAGNENDRLEVTRFCAMLNGLAADAECAVVLTHHTSKSHDNDDTNKIASGSTAWINASRSVLSLKPEDAQGGSAELHVRKANHHRKPAPLPLEWTDNGLLLPTRSDSSVNQELRDRNIDNALFETIDNRWKSGSPLSDVRTQSDRYAPRIVASEHGYSAKDVEKRLNHWLNRGNVTKERIDGKQRNPVGLRVKDWPLHTMTKHGSDEVAA